MNTTIYNPANKRKEQLIDEFVIRTSIFEKIIYEIKNYKNEEIKKHFLIVGQRGSGKTTLIHRLKYAIEDDKGLRDLIPITLGEEQYGITELTNLWEKIGEILEDYYGFTNLYEKIQLEISKTNNESNCFEKIVTSLKSANKQVILFIDNFGDLVSKLSEEEVSRLKIILKTNPSIQIVAATPVFIEDMDISGQESFFSLFEEVKLMGLNNDEIKTLLLRLSNINNSEHQIKRIINEFPERLEILRLLTGGVTRTIVSLYKIFIDNIAGTSIRDLQLTLDAVTPLYKHRMDDLKKNQQKIVDVVAKSWDATSVKEIAKTTRIESKIISAQLQQLEKNQIVEKILTGKKNHLYQIKERFFNIWYLMRYGRKYDKQRVIWLVRFLESWCSKEELENRISSYIHLLKEGEYDNEAVALLGEAYLGCKSINVEMKKQLILESKELLPSNLTKGMSIDDIELLKKAIDLYDEQLYLEAINYALDISKKDNHVNSFITNAYFQMDDDLNALKYSEKVLENGSNEGSNYSIHGSILYRLGEYKQAVKYLLDAIDKGADETHLKLGHIYLTESEFELAEKHLMKALKFKKTKVKALHTLGHLYEMINDKPKAIEHFEKAIKLGNHRAEMCLASFYYNNDELKKTIYHYKNLLEQYPEEAGIKLSRVLLENDMKKEGLEFLVQNKNSKNDIAQYNIGIIYHKILKDLKKAKIHYLKAIKLGNKSAYHKIAHVYEDMDDFDNAESAFLKSYELKEDYSALLCLASLYNRNEVNEGIALEHIEKAKEFVEFDFQENLLYAMVLLSNSKIEETVIAISNILENFKKSNAEYEFKEAEVDGEEVEVEDHEEEFDGIIQFFVELISLNYCKEALELINTHNLKEILKPIYFTLMWYMKDDYPEEYL